MKAITALIAIFLFNGVWSQPNPVASFSSSSTQVCVGKSITFTDNSTSPGNIISWNWSFSGGTASTSNIQNPPPVYFYGAGAYPIKLIVVDDNGNTDEKTITIIVNANPTAYATNTGPTCSGSQVIITASGSGNSFSWSGPNGLTSSSNSITIPNIMISQFGNYTVTITNSNGCSSTANTDVVMGAGPNLVMTGTDVNCFGQADGIASVVASGGLTPYNYNWYSGSTTSIATNLPSGWEILSVTDANHCYSIDSVFINEPTEIILNSTATPSKCYVNDGSGNVEATGGVPGSGYSYSWFPSGGNNSATTPIGPGEYVVTVTDSKDCKVNDTIQVDVINEPILNLLDSSDITCFGDNNGRIETEMNGGTPGYTYIWSPTIGDTNIASGLPPGVYSVTGIDNMGCKTDTFEVTITEPDSLIVNMTTLGTTCGYKNGEIVLDVSGGSGDCFYLWSPGVSTSNSAIGLGVGSYDVTVSDSLGCSQLLSINIDVGEPFSLSAIPNIVTIPKGDSVAITLDVDPNIVIAGISWTPSEGLSCSNCIDPVAIPSDTTLYIVEVTSVDGCLSTDSVLVIVKFPCGELFVPTIFSPDGDGVNDYLCIKGRCIVSTDFMIFNRWGETVFQTTDNEECWDGTYKDKFVETGVFVYKLVVVKEDGETINQTGNITVVR